MTSSPDDYKISTEEAFCFLRDVLEIQSAETKIKANKVTFLDEIIRNMRHHIPYQTINGISIPPGNRRLPTAADIKTDIISKMGGLCYQLNVFCWMLLRALGFDASLVPSDVRHNKDFHVGILIDGLIKPGSKHLFDVGTGYPTSQVIPLDFEHVSPEYVDSFLRHRFVRQDNGVIIQQHSVDTNPPQVSRYPDFVKDGWFSFFFIHIDQSVSVTYFDPVMTNIFTVASAELPVLTSLRCMAYPNGRLVCIKDATLLVESEEGRMQISHFLSCDQILEAFGRYFPRIPQNMIKAAMENVQIDFQEKFQIHMR